MKEKEKEKIKKTANEKEKEKEKEVVPSVAVSNFPITESTPLIGGFTPFLPPNPVKRDAFLQAIKDSK